MHVIAMSRLRGFWAVHPEAEMSLRTWFKQATKARWNNLAELHGQFPSADYVPPVYTIFDISHNKYRLITVIDYRLHTVWVHRILTPPEYDRWNP
ncbi:MAG TPA: type II toxin-antitoxin system HigB family toxin [Terriglobia bacterium]|jgi:mRNA interferase HigB